MSIKTDIIGNDFGSFHPIRVTICRTQGIEEVIMEHRGIWNEVLGHNSLRRTLDVVSSDSRSVTCTVTGDTDSCPVCGDSLLYQREALY